MTQAWTGAPTGGDRLEPEQTLTGRLNTIEAARRPDENLRVLLRAELTALRPALKEARRLTEFVRGRYEVAWRKDLFGTPLPHLEKARAVAKLLRLDAALRADSQDLEGALVSTRAILNAGRSIGDEPTIISQVVRIACRGQAVLSLERALAQGVASDKAVALTQSDFARESNAPLLGFGVRGERAAMAETWAQIATGEMRMEQVSDGRPQPAHWYDGVYTWGYLYPIAPYNHAVALRSLSRALALTALPPAGQIEGLRKWGEDLRAELRSGQPYGRPALLLLPAVDRVANAEQRSHAELNCACTALAAERYRVAHHRWPGDLSQLQPTFLASVPADPFSTGRVHYRRLHDGLVIYSVGLDQQDNGGHLDRKDAYAAGVDIGFRLWDAEARRQPLPRAAPPAIPAD
jgi:hypothetical protein